LSYIGKPATGIDLCVTAFDVTTQAKSRMVVVPIPGLPADYWFVCNERGIHWSPGA